MRARAPAADHLPRAPQGSCWMHAGKNQRLEDGDEFRKFIACEMGSLPVACIDALCVA